MWCISKGPDMMGLPTNKRKLDNNDCCPMSPAKQCRNEDQVWVAEAPSSPAISIQQLTKPSKLEELASVAPPDWAAQRPALITTLLDDDDDEFDDEDFDDEDDDDDDDRSCELTSRSSYSCYEDTRTSSASSGASPGGGSVVGQYWGCPQQTIRCEENGKSYLELGPSPTSSRNRTPSVVDKCCDGERTSWCRRAPDSSCYRQRRLAVFNLSMCKLGRYRQFTDPSLLRSVLICNTLRYIEREMEQEGCFYGAGPCPVPPPPLPQAPSPAEVDPTFPSPQFLEVPDISSYRAGPEFYEQSGRATPFPTLNDTDSGMGDDENARSINWGSVLSLSSQSDLDPMNNNELYSTGSESSHTQDLTHEFEDFLPNWKSTTTSCADITTTITTTAAATTTLPSCQHIQQSTVIQDLELMQVLVSS